MKKLIYKMILWWLNRRLADAEIECKFTKFDNVKSLNVDRLVIATEAMKGLIK